MRRAVKSFACNVHFQTEFGNESKPGGLREISRWCNHRIVPAMRMRPGRGAESSAAPPGRMRVRMRCPVVSLCSTTEVAEGNSGGRWAGEQANFPRPSGTHRHENPALKRWAIFVSPSSRQPPPKQSFARSVRFQTKFGRIKNRKLRVQTSTPATRPNPNPQCADRAHGCGIKEKFQTHGVQPCTSVNDRGLAC